jgi:hypothetical protein
MSESWNKRRHGKGGFPEIWVSGRRWIDNVRQAPPTPGGETARSGASAPLSAAQPAATQRTQADKVK